MAQSIVWQQNRLCRKSAALCFTCPQREQVQPVDEVREEETGFDQVQ